MNQLSKSDYMLYLRHPAWLWLKKHDKAKLPLIDADTQARFDAGFLFETYAEQLFPGAFNVGFADYQSYLSLPHRTKQALSEGHKTLFQGRFEHEHLTCIFDCLMVVGEDVVDLYEIKSSTEVKPEHLLDLAFQQAVIEGAGLKVRNIYVIHVNNQYVRHGDIDANQLCTTTEVTADVEALRTQTTQNIAGALEVMASKTRPDISPAHAGLGAYKDWLAIYKTLVPTKPDSIYDLASAGASRIGQLEALHISKLADIPKSIELTERQQLQVQAARESRPLIDTAPIKDFLKTLVYPLYFLDYETLAGVIPAFDGVRPYQQVPFQYSLHILEAPNAPLRHATYLHRENSNPVMPLSETLQRDFGPTGSIVVWYKDFETARNTEMGLLEPKFKEFYEQLNTRVVDLMEPFANNWYTHQDFHGSASIKQVLPVLVPELSYTELAIHDGGAAQRLWIQAVLEEKLPRQKDQILADLEKYCALDTLAMVKIYEVLRRL